MKSSKGRIWPYAIGGSIIMVFGFCVATIVVTQGAHIQESDAYMTHYQDADANANDLIEAEIAFNKKYTIEYVTDGISAKDAVVKYKLTRKDNSSVNDAQITLATSRPETKEFNQNLSDPTVEDGVYSFSGLEFPKVGVWNLIAKVKVGNDYRFYNIKADTRIKEAFEF
ncbi:MAG: FixH family protein [Campylobacterota bacterium]|nr:FixH family protein [Campylobacterota bacterium]